MRFRLGGKIDYKKILLFLIILSLLSSLAYAYRWACLSEGEKLASGWTCEHDCCFNICVTESNYATNPSFCYDFPPCFCGGQGGNFTDLKAPDITINSPVNGNPYFSRAVLFDIHLSEVSYLYYQEVGKERYGWKKLCSDKCSRYSRYLSFDDGEHTLTVRAVDTSGNEDNKSVAFYIDSIAPRIRATYPKQDGYGNGEFIIEYSELNVVSIVLYYKENGLADFKSITKTDCPSSNDGICTFEISGLAQGPLTYYFSLTDRAQTVSSPIVGITIDTIPPVLDVTSPHNPILVYNNGKILMNLSVNEPSDLNYIDYSDARPRYKLLCKSCTSYSKTKNFKDGNHNVTIRATDKAGNQDTYQSNFLVDSKKPVIKRTLPISNSYDDGTFTIIYDEFNTKNITLFYKQNLTDPYTLVTKYDCPNGRNVQCTLNANGIKQGKLYYHFSIGDVAGWNTVQIKETPITIDTVKPILTLFRPINTTYNTTRIWFTANISEKVTLEYANKYSSSPTWKRLCTSCDYYDMYKSFSYGDYSLTVRARDNAGNSDEKDVSFSVVRS